MRDRAGGVEGPLLSACVFCGSPRGRRDAGGWACADCDWRVGDIVDRELPPPRIDVVYYLRLDDRVKIGTTANPRQRFAALPHEQVMAFELGDRHLEHRRHREFAADRLGTSEWFALSSDLAAHIAAVADGVDPWRQYVRWVSAATPVLG